MQLFETFFFLKRRKPVLYSVTTRKGQYTQVYTRTNSSDLSISNHKIYSYSSSNLWYRLSYWPPKTENTVRWTVHGTVTWHSLPIYTFRAWMHSSRMRTGRSLTVCREVGGGGSPSWGVSLAGGCLLAGGLLPRGCLLGGVSFSGEGGLLGGGVSLAGGSPWQGCLLGGVSFPGGASLGGLLHRGGGSPSGGWVSLRQTPPVDRITDTSKNITLATTS